MRNPFRRRQQPEKPAPEPMDPALLHQLDKEARLVAWREANRAENELNRLIGEICVKYGRENVTIRRVGDDAIVDVIQEVPERDGILVMTFELRKKP